jgi:hypothetical protein
MQKIGILFFEGKQISVNFGVLTVAVAQLVRASDCGSEGRGFETPQSPLDRLGSDLGGLFFLRTCCP